MGEPGEALQFDRAEVVESRETRTHGGCAVCRRSFDGGYFDVNGKATCHRCREAIAFTFAGPIQAGAAFGALGWGLLAAIAGSAIFYAVRAISGYEIGLVGIVVGLLVGYGVRKGCRGRGGWFYQAMAMLLTYLAIVSTYVPGVLGDLKGGAPFVVELALAFFVALLAPFLAGAQNLMGLVIIGFALYEAWKLNRRVPLDIKGPFATGR